MKKIKQIFVFTAFLSTLLCLFSCNNDVSDIKPEDRMLKINDTLYYGTSEVGPMGDSGCIEGKISSTVKPNEIPKEDGQSNFGSIGSSYTADTGDGFIMVFIEEEWFCFYKENYKNPSMPADVYEFLLTESELPPEYGNPYQIQLVMTEGTYYDEEFAGSGGGTYSENYNGKYEIRVYKKGVKEPLDIYQITADFEGNTTLNFGKSFEIPYEDYNADGNPEFTIGQYGSNSMNLYCLYSISKEGKIKKLLTEPIANNTKEFSVILEKAGDLAFYQNLWDNASGAMRQNIYEWNEEKKIFELQKPLR